MKREIVWEVMLEMDFPDNWTPEDVEFRLNETGYCADNALELAVAKSKARAGACLCEGSHFRALLPAVVELHRRAGEGGL